MNNLRPVPSETHAPALGLRTVLAFMHLLAVLVKLPLQLRNDCSGRCSLAYLKTHFWERAGCAFSEDRVPSDIADVPSWRIHGRAGMRKLYHVVPCCG